MIQLIKLKFFRTSFKFIGKTLAYALPIIQILQNSFVRLIRCLVVLPVQELATQVYEVISKCSSETTLRIALITGASSFKEEQEKLVKISKSFIHQFFMRISIQFFLKNVLFYS